MNDRMNGLESARRAHAAGRPDEARKLCAKHLAAAPKDASAQHFMATLAAEAGRLDIALIHARRAVKNAPRTYATRLDLAKILLLTGKERGALRESESALALRPDDVRARFEHAKIVYNSSQLESAEPILLSVVADWPELAEAHAMLAAVQATFDRPAEALESADKAVAAGHHAADLHEIRGKALLDLEQPLEARDAFRLSVRMEPGRLSALRGLSLSSQLIGDNKQAKAALLQHIQLQPFEKVGQDTAKTKILVSDEFGGRGAFWSHSIGQMYSRINYISGFSHPEFQRVHYLADYVDPVDIIRNIGDVHVIFNNICNAELIAMLGGGEKLQESFVATGLPVINPVQKVLATSRAENYLRLKDDPEILFPRTIRFDVGEDPKKSARQILNEFAPPFLIRPISTNMRAGLRLIKHDRELLEGSELIAGRSYYAIDYYRSVLRSPVSDKEGAFQLRAAVIDGKIFPDRVNWCPGDFTDPNINRAKLDYDGKGITEIEKNYITKPENLLDKPLNKIFANLIKVLDLDIFGIDFSITETGKIIVFEANSSMNLFTTKHHVYSPYQIEERKKFGEEVAKFIHKRAGH